MSRDIWFAFIVNVGAFPNPFLVEVSRRTRTTGAQVKYYMPNVVYCPCFCNGVLTAVLHCPMIFRNHRKVVKETVLEFVRTNNEDKGDEETRLIRAVILAVAELNLEAHFRETRKSSRIKNSFLEVLLDLRQNRLQEEAHLGYSFTEDLARSLIELKFIRGKYE